MTSAASQYEELQKSILRGRALGTLPEEAEDSLLEQMDDLWWEMTEEERREADRRAAESQHIRIREELHHRDTSLPQGANSLPREAA